MDNTAGANGGIFTSGTEQDNLVAGGVRMNMPNNFDSLNPAGNTDFDNYVKQRTDLAPQPEMQMPPMPMGGEISPDMIDMMPTMPEATEASAETMSGVVETGVAEDGKPKGYESEAVAEERKKKAKAEAEAAEKRERMPELETIKSINVARDAEKIPKDYMKIVAAGIEHRRNNPADMVDFCEEVRWDYMQKAFGRGFGDGLHGDGKAGK